MTMSPKSPESLKPALCHPWTFGIVLAATGRVPAIVRLGSGLTPLMMIVKAQCPGSLGP
mgnify:CR=1 FL=1